MEFLARLFGRSPRTADTAKERLQFVLAHDRSDISPETLNLLKDEIVNVISKHVEIDREHVEVTVTRAANVNKLVANIPVIRPRPPRAKTSPRRRTARAAPTFKT
ncbi:MAG: cell division topological specificity factor MinE [Chloroflexota bacterium]|nr:cell division topological specificity factor MinE [Chloroflexota bacterium]